MIFYERTNRLTDLLMAKKLLDGLENFYPGFQFWFINKCMPGVLAGNDILVVAREHGQIVGVALAKKSKEETKLRCVRVAPAYQNRGLAFHLIDMVLHDLDDDAPYVTVSEEMLHLYSRAFINRYHWRLDHVSKGHYRPRKLEYLFNMPGTHPVAESAL